MNNLDQVKRTDQDIIKLTNPNTNPNALANNVINAGPFFLNNLSLGPIT